MNWIANFVRPRIKSLMAGRGTRYAREPLEEMPRLRGHDFPSRSRTGPVCLPAMRLSHARSVRKERFATILRRRRVRGNAAARSDRRSAAFPRRAPLFRPAEGRAQQNGPPGSVVRSARHDRRLAGDDRGAAVRFPGRFAGHGRGRSPRARHAGRRCRDVDRSFSLCLPAARACRKAFSRSCRCRA